MELTEAIPHNSLSKKALPLNMKSPKKIEQR
jgi:hypothetical protein